MSFLEFILCCKVQLQPNWMYFLRLISFYKISSRIMRIWVFLRILSAFNERLAAKFNIDCYFRYGVYAVNFDSPNKERTLTTFGEEYRKVINNNGFPTDHLTSLLPLTSDRISIPVSHSFAMLPASDIPSNASVSIWKVTSSAEIVALTNYSIVSAVT